MVLVLKWVGRITDLKYPIVSVPGKPILLYC